MRIIPARAGFTAVEGGLGPGEVGSSPLARGLRPLCRHMAACSSDHPRSRGVYRASCHETGPPAGSSPLARGLPHPGLLVDELIGIIPARAGFTRLRPLW